MKKIIIVLMFVLSIFISTEVSAFGYGIPKNEKGDRPFPGDNYHNIITNNYGMYLGKDTNTVYLTFDNGYENGYTKNIIDVLKENDVTGLFFITGHYLNDNSDIVKYMLENNQLVGNHSYSHKDFSKLSNSEIKSDLNKLEHKYKSITGESFSPFFRPPEGTFNATSLNTVGELGYLNLFWSLAYKDWYKDQSYGIDHVVNSIIPYLHNGAIILLHTVSKDNSDSLSRLIKEIKDNGYNIGNPLDLLVSPL